MALRAVNKGPGEHRGEVRNRKSGILFPGVSDRSFLVIYLAINAFMLLLFIFGMNLPGESAGPNSGLWQARLFFWELVAFLLFLWMLFHFKSTAKIEDARPPSKFLFNGAIPHALLVFGLGALLIAVDYASRRSSDIVSYFPMLVPPMGLFLLRNQFYSFSRLFGRYQDLTQVGSNRIALPGESPLQETSPPRKTWEGIRSLWQFQFGHRYYIYNAFVILQFAVPAAAIIYSSTGNFGHSILIGIEYYFIGMATWTAGLGAGLVLWTAIKLPITTKRSSEDEYKLHNNAAFWSILVIALTPGVGIPAVLRLNEAPTYAPVQSALFYFLVANVIVFVVSIYGIHEGMAKSKEANLGSLSARLDELERKLESDLSKPPPKDELDARLLALGETQVLQGELRDAKGVPVWPVKGKLAINFLITLLPILYQLLVLGLRLF